MNSWCQWKDINYFKIEISDPLSSITEIKNSLGEINSRLGWAEWTTSGLEGRAVDFNLSEKRKKK